jgi:hypothetical protein
MTIANTVWLATALLHQENPDAAGFTYDVLLKKVGQLDPSLNPRSVNTHLSTHCIASKKANPMALRFLTENPDGTLRLYRPGDPCHPTREGGRTAPKPHSIPEEYRHLLHVEQSSPPRSAAHTRPDPILAMSGVGKQMWQRLGGGDAFISALRAEVFPTHAQANRPGPASTILRRITEKLASRQKPDEGPTKLSGLSSRPVSFDDDVWPRIEANAGQDFHTVTGKPFSDKLRSNAVVPRPGKGPETNRQLPRNEFRKAWDRRPLSGPGQIHELQGPSYIYAILTDPRICGQ